MQGSYSLDLNALTFSGDKVTNVAIAGETFTLTNGKILKVSPTTPSGMPADSIVLKLSLVMNTLLHMAMIAIVSLVIVIQA